LRPTLTEPFRGFAPIPLSIETAVAFVVIQESVEDWPVAIEAGVAVRVIVGAVFTVTVVWHVAVPPGPVAVGCKSSSPKARQQPIPMVAARLSHCQS